MTVDRYIPYLDDTPEVVTPANVHSGHSREPEDDLFLVEGDENEVVNIIPDVQVSDHDPGVIVPEGDIIQCDQAMTGRQRGHLLKEAQSYQHQLTHLPKNPFCHTCARGKATNKRSPHTSGSELYKQAKRSGNDSHHQIVVLDVHTRWLQCYPVVSKEADEICEALRDFCGPHLHIKTMYARTMHQSWLEQLRRKHGYMKEQYQAFPRTMGLDPRWWPHAARCFCHMNNVQKKDGMSPWLRRFPATTYEGDQTGQVRTKNGDWYLSWILLAAGGKWKGDYLCISLADLRDGQVTAVQRVATISPPPSKIYRFPLAEEKDPYSDQWRFSHGLLGTESGGDTPASRFPYKDDTSQKGGTDEDLDERPVREDRAIPRHRTEFTSNDDIPPPAPSSSSGGRRDGDVDRESVRAVPPTSSAGSSSGTRAPLERDRAPDRDDTREEQTIMARTEEAEPQRQSRPQIQGERPLWWPEDQNFHPGKRSRRPLWFATDTWTYHSIRRETAAMEREWKEQLKKWQDEGKDIDVIYSPRPQTPTIFN
eukprot:6492594-Amphidinium_carterae.1